MRLPRFNGVSLVVPVVEACRLHNEVGKVRQHLRKLYGALGGDTSAAPYREGRIGDLKDSLKQMVSSCIDRAIKNLWKGNSRLKREFSGDAFMLDYGIKYNFFSSGEIPRLLIQLEIAQIFAFCLEFVKGLQEERPKVYPLMRRIGHLLYSRFPVYSTPWASESVLETLEMDRMESGDEAEDAYSDDIEKEVAEFKEHIADLKIPHRRLLREVKELHEQVAWELTPEENWFVLTAIQLFEVRAKWHWKNIVSPEDVDPYCDERHDVAYFFNLLWRQQGFIADYVDSFAEGSGEQMAPAITLEVTDKESLRKAKEIITSFLLFEGVMMGGYQIWNKRY